jgi:hypothetical protein
MSRKRKKLRNQPQKSRFLNPGRIRKKTGPLLRLRKESRHTGKNRG